MQKYMVESDQGDQDQVKAPSSGEQEKGIRDHALRAG